MRRRLVLGTLVLAAMGLALPHCSRLGYYGQAVRGGLQVLHRREPIPRLLADPSLDPELRRRLAAALAIREFASRELGLPDNASYRTYADLERPFAVWSVTAAPELSVEPVTWCFPFAGCVSYRGYFRRPKAERFATRLRSEGYDVDVGGVIAYSTLGWLKDPVLNTFIGLPEPELAGLLFHELAHQVVYVRDDTTFTESFATAVELEGVERWLRAAGRETEMGSYRQRQARQDAGVELMLAYRQRLAAVYAGPRDDAWKRRRKAELLDELTAAYRELAASWDAGPAYEEWIARGFNNARLAAVGAYHELVPGFAELLAREGRDLPRFYEAVRELASRPQEERRAVLDAQAAARSLPPALCFDEAHHNVHTTTRGYPAFVELARETGFSVVALRDRWTEDGLAPCDLLVTVSPRGTGREGSLLERGRPAYTAAEVDLAAEWLSGGGGLLLITDHPPIGSAAQPLADALGIDMGNAFTEDPEHAAEGAGYLVFSRANGLLASHPLTEGSGPGEAVHAVATFLGQSLAGPPGAVSFLTLGPGARDRVRRSTDRLWLEPSPRDPLRPAAGRSQGLALVVGRGRVVALADAAMLTALGRNSGFDTPGVDNEQLAVNILRWLARDL